MDENDDGRISPDEFFGPPEFFERLDRDGDGVVTEKDFAGDTDARRGRGGDRPAFDRGGAAGRLFGRLDRDRDGKISRQDLSEFFGRADVDDDGSISQEELERFLRAGGGRPGGRDRDRAVGPGDRDRGPRDRAFGGGGGRGGFGRFQSFGDDKPAPGQLAPDFELKDLAGHPFTLAKLVETKPVVIEFGSFT